MAYNAAILSLSHSKRSLAGARSSVVDLQALVDLLSRRNKHELRLNLLELVRVKLRDEELHSSASALQVEVVVDEALDSLMALILERQLHSVEEPIADSEAWQVCEELDDRSDN